MVMAHSRKEERHRGDQYAFIQEKGQCKTDLVPIMFDPVHSNVIARHHVVREPMEVMFQEAKVNRAKIREMAILQRGRIAIPIGDTGKNVQKNNQRTSNNTYSAPGSQSMQRRVLTILFRSLQSMCSACKADNL
jgi:hypothetical protein